MIAAASEPSARPAAEEEDSSAEGGAYAGGRREVLHRDGEAVQCAQVAVVARREVMLGLARLSERLLAEECDECVDDLVDPLDPVQQRRDELDGREVATALVRRPA